MNTLSVDNILIFIQRQIQTDIKYKIDLINLILKKLQLNETHVWYDYASPCVMENQKLTLENFIAKGIDMKKVLTNSIKYDNEEYVRILVDRGAKYDESILNHYLYQGKNKKIFKLLTTPPVCYRWLFYYTQMSKLKSKKKKRKLNTNHALRNLPCEIIGKIGKYLYEPIDY